MGHTVFIDVIKLKWGPTGLGLPPIQYDCCPIRGAETQTHIQKESHSNKKDRNNCQRVREKPGMVSPSEPPEGAITDLDSCYNNEPWKHYAKRSQTQNPYESIYMQCPKYTDL